MWDGWYRVPRIVRGAYYLLAAALLIFWFVTYSGPVRWFAELQLSVSNTHSRGITMVLTALVVFGPVSLLLSGLGAAGVFDRFQSRRSERRWQPWEEFLRRYRWALGLMMLGLVFLVLALVGVFRGATAGPLSPLDVAAVEAGQPLPSNWLQLHGRALPDQTVRIEKKPDVSEYLPLVSPRWRPGDPVAAFVKLPSHRAGLPPGRWAEAGGNVTAAGVVHRNGLPGIAQTIFKQNQLRLADDYVLIDVTEEPDQVLETGAIGLVVAALMLVAGLVVAVVRTLWR